MFAANMISIIDVIRKNTIENKRQKSDGQNVNLNDRSFGWDYESIVIFFLF